MSSSIGPNFPALSIADGRLGQRGINQAPPALYSGPKNDRGDNIAGGAYMRLLSMCAPLAMYAPPTRAQLRMPQAQLTMGLDPNTSSRSAEMKRREFLAAAGSLPVSRRAGAKAMALAHAPGAAPYRGGTAKANLRGEKGLRLSIVWGMMGRRSVAEGLALLSNSGFDAFEMFDWRDP